jgi:shikimate dehydrogenase
VTDRYAVVGNPVAHSKSPLIHAQFARQTGEDIEYDRILAPLDGFRATVEQFRRGGGKGLNVTVPFKLEAFALATQRSQRALDAEAVNVLKFDGERIEGHNTDGIGLVRDIEVNLGFSIAGRRVLLMGAGGAAQGTLAPVLEAGPVLLIIGNRTVGKAQRLAQRFASMGRFPGVEVGASDYASLAGRVFDLIINATSASLSDTVPELPAGVFAPGSLAYDMMYGKGLTPFLAVARAQGAARLADGIGMLVEQAAESFLIWRGMRPRTDAVIAQLKTGL